MIQTLNRQKERNHSLLLSVIVLSFTIMSTLALNSAGRARSRIASSVTRTKSPRLYSAKPTNQDIHDAKHKELIAASKLSLAPMMEYTDRHFRHVVRLISKRTLVYTEMVAGNTLSFEREKNQACLSK